MVVLWDARALIAVIYRVIPKTRRWFGIFYWPIGRLTGFISAGIMPVLNPA